MTPGYGSDLFQSILPWEQSVSSQLEVAKNPLVKLDRGFGFLPVSQMPCQGESPLRKLWSSFGFLWMMNISGVGCLDVFRMEVVSVSELHSHCLLDLGLDWELQLFISLPCWAQTPAERGRPCCHHTSSAWEQVSFCHPALPPEVLPRGSGSLTGGLTNRSGFKSVADCCHHKQICLSNFQNLPG